jgi:hypothetical protein
VAAEVRGPGPAADAVARLDHGDPEPVPDQPAPGREPRGPGAHDHHIGLGGGAGRRGAQIHPARRKRR